jgi:tRNA pseudouridine38-40 synthase
MNAAAQLLIGEKDFSSFAKIHTDVKNHICNVSYAKWEAKGEEVFFEISANRFLRNMVRAIVGTCVDVGLNKMSIQEFQEIIDSKDRQKGSGSAPPQGLFLWMVEYKKS